MNINPNIRLNCLTNENYLFNNYAGKYFTQKMKLSGIKNNTQNYNSNSNSQIVNNRNINLLCNKNKL